MDRFGLARPNKAKAAEAAKAAAAAAQTAPKEKEKAVKGYCVQESGDPVEAAACKKAYHKAKYGSKACVTVAARN